eukprot:scaffold111352_cov37-Prasinocladus_malaysianus.AAC.1
MSCAANIRTGRNLSVPEAKAHKNRALARPYAALLGPPAACEGFTNTRAMRPNRLGPPGIIMGAGQMTRTTVGSPARRVETKAGAGTIMREVLTAGQRQVKGVHTSYSHHF